MPVPRTLAPTLLALGLLAAPAAAHADGSLEVGIGDDRSLGAADGPQTADAWKAAGVQRVRVLANWQRIAGESTKQTRKPDGFDPDTDYAWGELDRKVEILGARGLDVTMTLTGPGPIWASREPQRRNPRWSPRPDEFAAFAAAAARRYGARVDRWIVWNEPNLSLWLQPQARRSGGRWVAHSPHVYRELYRAGDAAIRGVVPDAEVLMGALAPQGTTLRSRNTQQRPLDFLKTMSCVSSSYRRLTTGECRDFRRVSAEGLAYHPHSSLLSPRARQRDRGNASMGDLSRVTSVVDRLQRAGRVGVRGASRMPLHLSEYAYQTNPPDRVLGVSNTRQADWLPWGWNTAYRNSRVRSVYQYVWFDEPRGGSADDGGVGFPGWQSGFYTNGRSRKPSLTAFRAPLFAYYTSRRGTLWGQARALAAGESVRVERRRGSGSYRAYKTVTPSASANGNWTLRIPRGTAYRYRVRFVAGDGERASRTVTPRDFR